MEKVGIGASVVEASVDSQVVLITAYKQGDEIGLSVNGQPYLTAIARGGSFDLPPQSVLLGGWGFGNDEGGGFYKGEFLEKVLLTSDETPDPLNSNLLTTKIVGYLAARWGARSALPDNHPYKSTPPSEFQA